MNIEPVTKCGFMFPFCTGQDNQDERKCLWLLSENKLLSQTRVNFPTHISILDYFIVVVFLKLLLIMTWAIIFQFNLITSKLTSILLYFQNIMKNNAVEMCPNSRTLGLVKFILQLIRSE